MDAPLTKSSIRCAGGAIWRKNFYGAYQVVLVRRTKYGDWSWPKGKLDEGEEASVAALREAYEETGYACKLGKRLIDINYHDQDGTSKTVNYWAMTVIRKGEGPNPSEISQVSWIDIDKADEMLSLPDDQILIKSLRDLLASCD